MSMSTVRRQGIRRRRRTVGVRVELLICNEALEAESVRLGQTLLLRADALRLHQHRAAALLQE